jgi:hypothetical protein
MPGKKQRAEAALSPERQEAVRANLPPDTPDLGEIRAVHVRRKTGPVAVFSLGGMAVAFATALLVLGLTKPADDKDRPALFAIAAVLGVAALASGGWGAFLLANPARSRPEEWLVCEDGLLRRRGPDVDVFPWDQLRIRKKGAHPLSRIYELAGHGGDPVVLNCPVLGGRMVRDIQKAQVRALRPKYLRAVEAGETIKFGRLGVCREGLAYRKAVLPWEHVKALNFSFDQRGTRQLFLTVPVRGDDDLTLNASEELPNIWLFMELVAKVHPPLAKYRDSQDWWLL